jgi:hypothetical protein
MSDHIVEPTKMVCPHCGLQFAREQNEIQSYRCGSNFSEKLYPQWARSMTCVELQNGQLQERLNRLEEAGDAMAEYLASGVDVDDWTAAKEVKP